jgi:hypothetical protein
MTDRPDGTDERPPASLLDRHLLVGCTDTKIYDESCGGFGTREGAAPPVRQLAEIALRSPRMDSLRISRLIRLGGLAHDYP